MLGGRHGTAPLTVHVDGEPRTLYVYAKSRGPIGLSTGNDNRCATGAPNTWVRLVVPDATGDVTIDVAEIDFPGERRGQTSPFVAVVSKHDEQPSLEPDERATAPGENDVLVRWAITPRACPQGIEHFKCMTASIELTDAKGALVKRVPIKNGLTGQLGCWPEGTGVSCGGPSGRSVITLESAQDGSGKVTVLETSESDGYCEPTMDCKSRATLAMFAAPRGARLVADPRGTWPPPPPPPQRRAK
jgi:hypothetical protein